jgi:hypothetical protein
MLLVTGWHPIRISGMALQTTGGKACLLVRRLAGLLIVIPVAVHTVIPDSVETQVVFCQVAISTVAF